MPDERRELCDGCGEYEKDCTCAEKIKRLQAKLAWCEAITDGHLRRELSVWMDKAAEQQAEADRLRAENDAYENTIIDLTKEADEALAQRDARPDLTRGEIRALLGERNYSVTPALQSKLRALLDEGGEDA